MAIDKKVKFLSKSVQLGAKTITLFSIDGNTWSSRKDELQAIIERHEAQKASFGKLKAAQSEGEDGKAEEAPEDDDKPVVAGSDEDEAADEDSAPKDKSPKVKAKPNSKLSAKESKKSEPKKPSKISKPVAKGKKAK